MRMLGNMIGAAALAALASATAAQGAHEHQTGPGTAQDTGTTQGGGTAQSGATAMPERCRAMMQSMPEGCMSMMRHMMQGGMMGQGSATAQAAAATQSDATKAYLAAMEKMHGPMMQGIQAADPEVAFVQGMIPHHQAAVDMATIVLGYAKDEKVRSMAHKAIDDQAKEIAAMRDWLRQHGR